MARVVASVKPYAVRAFERPPAKAYVIHGEAQASQALASALRQQQGWGTSEVVVPSHGSAYAL